MSSGIGVIPFCDGPASGWLRYALGRPQVLTTQWPALLLARPAHAGPGSIRCAHRGPRRFRMGCWVSAHRVTIPHADLEPSAGGRHRPFGPQDQVQGGRPTPASTLFTNSAPSPQPAAASLAPAAPAPDSAAAYASPTRTPPAPNSPTPPC